VIAFGQDAPLIDALLHRPDEVLVRPRLRQEPVNAALVDGPLQVVDVGLVPGRQQDALDARRRDPDLRQKPGPVVAGHLEIGHHHLNIDGREAFEALERAVGLVDLDALTLEDALDGRADEVLVVHHQQGRGEGDERLFDRDRGNHRASVPWVRPTP
jgi:hypothetical protein